MLYTHTHTGNNLNKRKRRIVCLISLSLTVMILGIIVYSENIKPIGIIENVKRALGEITQKSNMVAQSNVTTIDVTGIVLGKETQHEHIYKTMYDENKHWEECTICGEIKGNVAHILVDAGWTMGNANVCHDKNVHKYICECGYLKELTEGKVGHVWNTVSDSNLYTGYDVCFNCNWAATRNEHKCRRSDGVEINCKNLGRCAICNYQYTVAKHVSINNFVNANQNVYCQFCNTKLCHVNDISTNSISDGVVEICTNITVPEGAVFDMSENSIQDPSASSSATLTRNGNVWISKQTIKYNSYSNEKSIAILGYYYSLNGINVRLDIDSYVKADIISPIIKDITFGNISSWSKNRAITISGTENYCSTVKIKILDDWDEEIYSGETTVNEGKYSISCTPDLEAGLEGRTFKVVVTDTCENSIEKEFTISKIDAISPEVTSGDRVSDEWAREKNFTFTASDQGIGNVQIAFNDVVDYALANKNGTEYFREYKLVGDVYSPREANVYYKDELGNVSTKKIVLDKLDNTRPKITGASFSNNKLNITAHDRHETEGEGSGVIKYRFLTAGTKLENVEIIADNSTEVLVNEDIIIPDIYKVKYVYVVAEDAVGNISNVYEVEVPQLGLTSKVNLSGANGKGIIELDWSSYDSANKYFVVYRKEKDSADWEKIVGIENKLTGNKYTDNLGNDNENPIAPSVNIAGNTERNSIDIIIDAQDNGSNYMYYVEAYDVNTSVLLSCSSK